MQRLFLGLKLAPTVHARAESVLAELAARPDGHHFRWTPAANLHLTLKFLGSVDTELMAQVEAAAREAVAGTDPIVFEARGLGAFPRAERARVLWLGVHEPSGALAMLAAKLEAAMEAIGFPREERSYSPHITLARSKEKAVDASELLTHPCSCGETRASELVLFESRDSAYLPRASIPLCRP